ncbi:protein THALLO [Lotus japonicus]|uniref:protein THALLO n=1 Tax=Lotus japonicus TaxID=34305 RepID=UPI0025895349|nr:protein THALLO [Lotus japonicus]
MGKKGGKSHSKKDITNAKTSSRSKHDSFSSDDMDDEIDAFHKHRDIVPLDVNDDFGESDEDDELPIFDSKDIDNDEDEDEEDGDDDEYDDDDDPNDNVAKIIRQRNFLRAKFGGGEDETQDDDDGDEEDDKHILGGRRSAHGADIHNIELLSSDDEAPKEEEEIAMQIQREKARSLTMEDYDLDISEDKVKDKSTLKDASDKGNREMKSPDRDITFKAEDLNALSKEEQMNLVYRCAPELIDWLSELNEAHKQLECKINPFLSKVQKGEIVMEGGVRYFELKQLLLLSYCQAITFYLLLKSEGHPVHDHPVVARLAEIRELLDQIKQLDAKLPVGLEDILKESNGLETVVNSDNENAPITIDSITRNQELPLVSAESLEEAMPIKVDEIKKLDSSKDGVPKARKVKHQKDHIGMRSLEMLTVRASLAEKWKKKVPSTDTTPVPSTGLKRSRPDNSQHGTSVFDDDAVGPARLSQGLRKSNLKKPKVISGDDDLPEKDDIGERRRKHELRVLASAGINGGNGDDDDDGDHGSPEDGAKQAHVEAEDSDNEFYEQVKQLRAAKLAAKAETYSRKSAASSLSETFSETIEGKRHITSQMEKNRGLTRIRNKDKKNPRKNYKMKHQKAVKNRKGQVQAIRKPTAPYGGEATGINASISRSVRFKS